MLTLSVVLVTTTKRTNKITLQKNLFLLAKQQYRPVAVKFVVDTVVADVVLLTIVGVGIVVVDVVISTVVGVETVVVDVVTLTVVGVGTGVIVVVVVVAVVVVIFVIADVVAVVVSMVADDLPTIPEVRLSL